MTGSPLIDSHHSLLRLLALTLLTLLLLAVAAMQNAPPSFAVADEGEERLTVALLVLPDGRIRSPQTVEATLERGAAVARNASGLNYLVSVVQGASTQSFLSPYLLD